MYTIGGVKASLWAQGVTGELMNNGWCNLQTDSTVAIERTPHLYRAWPGLSQGQLVGGLTLSCHDGIYLTTERELTYRS